MSDNASIAIVISALAAAWTIVSVVDTIWARRSKEESGDDE